jgi:(4S)-4-hydroxy-5-phosphonooxypentane-2,3-dione isomerase
MLALMVTIKIKPGHHDAFMEAMLGDARGPAYDEPGCLRFDVVQDANDPNTIYLYEVYRDEAAIEAHR